MGVQERRAREREGRRELFVDVAEELIAEVGFERMTIEQLTRRAEFSKRTFYLYFEDKQEIHAAVARRAHERLQERLDRALGLDAPPLERIRAMSWAYFDFFRGDRAAFDSHLRYEEDCYHYRKTADDAGPEARAYLERLDARDGRLRELFAEALETVAIRSELMPPQLLLLAWGQLVGILRMVAVRETVLPTSYGLTPEQLFAASVDNLIGGLVCSND